MKTNKAIILLVGTLVLGATSFGVSFIFKNNTHTNQKCEIVTDSSCRHEYIIQEKFDPTGLYLNVNDELIGSDKYQYEYDFSSSGDKLVKINYERDQVTYYSTYQVKVFFVNHLDFRDYKLSYNIDGTYSIGDFDIRGNLDGLSDEFPRTPEYPEYEQRAVVLQKNNISYEIDDLGDNWNQIIAYAGNSSATANKIFYSYDPTSYQRHITFSNESSNLDTLDLYYTYNSHNFVDPHIGGYDLEDHKITVKGVYVLNKGKTSEKQYRHEFVTSFPSWETEFKSNSYESTLTESRDDNKLFVKIDKTSFSCPDSEWQSKGLGM